MSKIDRKIMPRGYQKLILDLIKLHTDKKKSVLLELDCGMGKRVVTYELLTSIFPESRILLVVLSSSSLVETKEFLQNEYGGVEGFNWLGPGISGSYAQKIMKDSRVILTTPQKLANIIGKSNDNLADSFDIIIINEVDKLVRRMGSKRVLVYPWPTLFEEFSNSLIIGMSGTLRDSHYVLDTNQIELRKELDTLQEFIPSSELIYMDFLAGTDVTDFTKETSVEAVPVYDEVISKISRIIGEQLREAYKEISLELEREDPEYLAQVKKIGPQALLQAPVSESTRAKAQSLTLIRKYLFSMVPQQLKKFIWKIPDLDVGDLPVTPQKVTKVVEIAKSTNKTVVLCSYINTAKTIASFLTRSKINSFIVTGQVFDKNAVLQDFRNYEGKAVLLMSPVGERDIDLPEADKLIIFDCVRTIKTVYQQLKRIRGGHGIFLYYEDSYEAKKVHSIIDNLIERYPWSTKQISNITPIN
ncbi:MAG TPA: DEAD/DEAH box helicase family protein [candidate division Zixibacteria bacterium]|nr:DEAD/DEAH box helicase family protein [candidate division Zixibacteria bacterium]